MKNSTKNPENTEALTGKRIIKSLKFQSDLKRSIPERIADMFTSAFGSITFLALNIFWFTGWIFANMGYIPGITPFDPYPFGLLTTTVSLEAIILAIFVLISQNRAAKVNDLREEVDLQVDVITEQEITKLMQMIALLMKKNGIDVSNDPVLREMMQPTDMKKIQSVLSRQVE
jgi:uncharacterized membrane protein